MSNSDNPKGILTAGDREYLRDKSLKSGSAERTARKRIRERVRDGIIDFSILLTHLESRDRAKVMLNSDGEPFMRGHSVDVGSPRELEWDLIEVENSEIVLSVGGIRSMCAFGFQSLLDTLDEIGFFETEGVHPKSVIENLVEESLQDAYGSNDRACDVSVDISITEYDGDLDEIEERFYSGEPVSEQEVEYLISTRRIGFEEMVRYVHDETRHKNKDDHYDDNRGFE
ncbi:hypothetical protein ACFQE1_01985 [Halobium palmae]|uniref:Domain of unknown function domain-containing protein n=1 Tax=Halobium palmae TaxID=1776492 RepID=A0ABD5RUS1_9EURY